MVVPESSPVLVPEPEPEPEPESATVSVIVLSVGCLPVGEIPVTVASSLPLTGLPFWSQKPML